MQSGDWEAKWAYNKRGMEIQRELSGGVRVETVRDSYGRVCSRSIGVNNIEQASHRYTWKQGNRLQSIINRLGETTSFEYDEWDNLVSGQYSNGKEMNTIYKAPDAIGNLFKTPERNDRSYDAGGSLIKDETYHYHYDDEGNLVFKEFIQVGYPALFERRVLEKMLNIKIKASGKGTVYEWAGNGMLKSVVHPLGYKVSFYYDALGRRIAKKKNSIVTRWLWDGNVPLHEWQYEGVYPPELSVDESKQLQQEAEPVENLITWFFEENSFVPCGKIVGKETYSIVSDYLGTPNFMYNAQGEKVWECTLDIYGKVRTLQGSLKDCPFRYQGQYDDVEIGLYYNRFRYYSPDIGGYISKDPIGLEGGNPTMYGYVFDSNTEIDPFGLDCKQKRIGDWGEKWAKEQLENTNKYKKVIAVQNGSNHGIDLVGIRKDGKFDFFEVKTNTTGRVSPISRRQANSSTFIQDILGPQKAQKGGWGISPAEARKMADPNNWGDTRIIDIFIKNGKLDKVLTSQW